MSSTHASGLHIEDTVLGTGPAAATSTSAAIAVAEMRIFSIREFHRPYVGSSMRGVNHPDVLPGRYLRLPHTQKCLPMLELCGTDWGQDGCWAGWDAR